MQSPYEKLSPQGFWRTGVADVGVYGLKSLWQSRWSLPQDARFATYGSCFAQHISRALRARDMGWVEGEAAPMSTPAALAEKYNYGVFSARTANIYTVAQLELLLSMVVGELSSDRPEIWPEGDRYRDSLRPMIEPQGFASIPEALASRRTMLRGLRRSIEGADVFVFTLGLTEAWVDDEGLPFAACPGTLGGEFDPQHHHLVRYTTGQVVAGLQRVLALLTKINPVIRLLLTVSPVPLTATASGEHVLVATTWSKSVLRAAAGEMMVMDERVDYFPSYEIITGPMTRSAFYEPNLRSVVPEGVEVVMKHFFQGLQLDAAPRHAAAKDALLAHDAKLDAQIEAEALVCEEAMLERFNV